MKKKFLLVFILLPIAASAQFYPPAKAFLSLKASQTQLSVGECTAIRFSFYVYDNNKAPIHFYDLGRQLFENIDYFAPSNAYSANNNIDDIVGVADKINSEGATRYDIYAGAICPVAPGEITIPPITIKMKHFAISRRDSMLVDYKTEPVTIKVVSGMTPADELAVRNAGLFSAGSFNLKETLSSKEIGTGDVLQYTMEINGNGSTVGLFPNNIDNKKFDVNLLSSTFGDTLENNTLMGHKTLKFEIIPKNGTVGSFTMSKILGSISYYDVVTRSVKTLTPGGLITVKNKNAEIANKLPSDIKKTFLFVLDVSGSMEVEDYTPTRLGFMLAQIERLAKRGYGIEIIIFAGTAKPVKTRTTSTEIRDIRTNMIRERGTAIGDAITYAIQYIETSGRNYSKRILLAGDGDSVGGNMSAPMATDYAKAKGFSIYSIGVGTSGPAPYGKDRYGNRHIVLDTFSEENLTMIAAKTGGRYVWIAKDGDLEALLKDVLTNP